MPHGVLPAGEAALGHELAMYRIGGAGVPAHELVLHLSHLLSVDDDLVPGSERRPGDLRGSFPGRLGDAERLGEAEVAPDLVAKVTGLPGDIEVLKDGPLLRDQISYSLIKSSNVTICVRLRDLAGPSASAAAAKLARHFALRVAASSAFRNSANYSLLRSPNRSVARATNVDKGRGAMDNFMRPRRASDSPAAEAGAASCAPHVHPAILKARLPGSPVSRG